MKRRILIVEDEIFAGSTMQDLLEYWGYEVSGLVSSGEEAIWSARNVPPDLILMDIKLQGEMDGLETARNIQRGSSIPIIFISGYGSEELLHGAGLAGPVDYLDKPFEIEELRRKIESMEPPSHHLPEMPLSPEGA